jgi:hypothetical protein
MSRSRSKKINILDALFSVLVDPGGTTQLLFRSSSLPACVVMLLLLFLSLYVVAPMSHNRAEGTFVTAATTIAPAVLSAILTVALASFLLQMALRIFQIRCSFLLALATVALATAPFSTLMLLTLAANAIMRGELTVMTYLATGFVAVDDIVVRFFPYLIRVVMLLALLIVSHSVRTLSRTSLGMAGLISAIIIPLLLGSFVVALSATELIFPGVSPRSIQLAQAFLTLPQ